jgi:hypothetical protein
MGISLPSLYRTRVNDMSTVLCSGVDGLLRGIMNEREIVKFGDLGRRRLSERVE